MNTITPDHDGAGLRIGIVQSRFNPDVGAALLESCRDALLRQGVDADDITLVTVPGALEVPLALQALARTGDYEALIALGAVIRGETYHFELVSNESGSGITRVQLDFDIPIANGILTTENDEQALVRAREKGADCAIAAIEMARLLLGLDDE